MKEQIVQGLQYLQTISGITFFGVACFVLKLAWDNYKEVLFQRLEKRLGKDITTDLKLAYSKFLKPIKIKEIMGDGKVDSKEKRLMQKQAKEFVMYMVTERLKAYPNFFTKTILKILDHKIEASLVELKDNSRFNDLISGNNLIKKKEEKTKDSA